MRMGYRELQETLKFLALLVFLFRYQIDQSSCNGW